MRKPWFWIAVLVKIDGDFLYVVPICRHIYRNRRQWIYTLVLCKVPRDWLVERTKPPRKMQQQNALFIGCIPVNPQCRYRPIHANHYAGSECCANRYPHPIAQLKFLFKTRVVTDTGFLMSWGWQVCLSSYISLLKGGVLWIRKQSLSTALIRRMGKTSPTSFRNRSDSF